MIAIYQTFYTLTSTSSSSCPFRLPLPLFLLSYGVAMAIWNTFAISDGISRDGGGVHVVERSESQTSEREN